MEIKLRLEFRCTRNDPYQGNCLGNMNLHARQGHYIEAESKEAALAEMKKRFPNDKFGFTVDLWK